MFSQVPIVGIIRGLTLEEVIEILPAYKAAGLTTLEITMNTAGAEDIIKYAVNNYGAHLNIGAGTVCTKKELKKAVAAGACFIVTPVLQKKIIKSCVKRGIPVFPGAFSPTEIYKAWLLGASMVKVYPAKMLGAGFIKDVKAPLQQIKLLPTGGVDLDNLIEFKKAGADGFGIGSQLFDKKSISERNWAGLQQHFQQYAQLAAELV